MVVWLSQDRTKSGRVSKVQWANGLNLVLQLDVPFLSYVVSRPGPPLTEFEYVACPTSPRLLFPNRLVGSHPSVRETDARSASDGCVFLTVQRLSGALTNR